MSTRNYVPRDYKTHLSRHLCIFGALLSILCILAVVQYHWINQVTEAERQRATATLTKALSGLETEFDIETSRAFATFDTPAAGPPDYAQRYKEWLRLAPHPQLLRGVYAIDPGNSNSSPKSLVPGEPQIGSGKWQQDLAKATLAVAPTRMSGPVQSEAGDRVFVQRGVTTAVRFVQPAVMIDGNPAFIFPMVSVFTTSRMARVEASASSFQMINVGHAGGPIPKPQLGLLVLDATYIKMTLLPRLVELHFPKAASDYDILVIDETLPTSSRAVFRSEFAGSESKFARPDGSTELFQLRLDCFLPPSPSLEPRSIQIASGPDVLPKANSLSEILTRRPATCDNTGAMPSSLSNGPWKVLVKYRAGSLDQALARFRCRNILLSGSVLLVLAMGMIALIAWTERARALAQMQTEFVLGVSHELRTPLTVIRLAADNLKEGLVDNSKQAHKYGEIIGSYALELSNMVEQALAFARTQSRAFTPNTACVSPEQLVRTSLDACQRSLQDAGMHVELDVEPSLPFIAVDVRLMNSCLENLIHNAVKYASVGKSIAVRLRKVNKPEGENVRISVEDRGPGISSIDAPHIFKPFYRGKQGDASQMPGVGLGLTLVKRVVEAHNGSVEMCSSRSGTSFSLFLPAYQSEYHVQSMAHV